MSDDHYMRFSPTLGAMQLSMTQGITAKAKALKDAGVDVAGMCAGEPDFDTPEHIKRAATDALAAGMTKYTPISGIPDLKKAIAAKFEQENSLTCSPDCVVVAPGAKFSVFSAITVLCGPGDEVIIPTPYWVSYSAMVEAAGATPVFVPIQAEDNFELRAEVLQEHITPATKLLILNSPGNPTGAVYSRATLQGIADVAVEHDIMVLADEIYEKLVYDDGFEHISIGAFNPAIAERTITVNGFSKAYSMTGWRLGYLTGPVAMIERIVALQSHTTSNANSFAQAGALAALTGPQEPVEEMRHAFAARRNRIHELLNAIPGLDVPRPHGAFYVFPNISAYGLNSMTFAERLLDEKKVAVIPGLPFGADDHIRLSYACGLDTIEIACSRLAEFCAALA